MNSQINYEHSWKMKPLYLRKYRVLPHSAGRIQTNYLLAALVVALIILWMLLGL